MKGNCTNGSAVTAALGVPVLASVNADARLHDLKVTEALAGKNGKAWKAARSFHACIGCDPGAGCQGSAMLARRLAISHPGS
jgi:hypothetical protein